MKSLILSAVAAMFCLSMSAMAADAENSDSTTVNHSKNPFTGTKKTTVTHKAKHKGDGAESKAKQTETTKEKTDGTVEKSTETKSKSSSGE